MSKRIRIPSSPITRISRLIKGHQLIKSPQPVNLARQGDSLCQRVDVQTHVVHDDGLPDRLQGVVHELFAQLLWQALHVRAQHDRGEELAWMIRFARRRLQPALG